MICPYFELKLNQEVKISSVDRRNVAERLEANKHSQYDDKPRTARQTPLVTGAGLGGAGLQLFFSSRIL